MSPVPTTTRRAFTLLEMAVATSLLSVVLALSMTTIVALLRVERQFAADARHELTIGRLAAQFRADVHRSTAAEIERDCKLTTSDGRAVRYAFAGDGVTRQLVERGVTIHRDSFLFDRKAIVSFTEVPGFDGRLLSLRIEPAGQPQSPRPSSIRPLIVEAALHRAKNRSAAEAGP